MDLLKIHVLRFRHYIVIIGNHLFLDRPPKAVHQVLPHVGSIALHISISIASTRV